MYIGYKVMINVDCGCDDTMNLEYSGVEHTKEETAKEELKRARKAMENEPKVNYVWLDKVEEY